MKAESPGAGLRSILFATAVAGVLGYAIQLLAPALLPDDASYISFSVYWSTLYLCVAALSGVQQEITRASRRVTNEPASPVLRQFVLIGAVTAVVVVTVLAVLFGPQILPGPTAFLAVMLSIGVAGYLLVAVLSGVFYGLRMWSAVAWITIADAVIRAALVLTGLVAEWSIEWIALAVSVPFGLAFLIMWVLTRRHVVGAFRLDVGLRRLLINIASTVVAAAAMGLMMNGLPMLLGVTASDTGQATLAGLILAITLTRAPIVVPLLALQSYLIAMLRGKGHEVRRRLLQALGLAVAAVALLSLAAALVGPWLVGVVSDGRSVISPAMMAAITAGAGIVAMMCVSGPALLGQGRHAPYVAGWVVAAVATVAGLLLPLPLDTRVALILIVPPAMGVVVHLAAVWSGREATPAASGADA